MDGLPWSYTGKHVYLQLISNTPLEPLDDFPSLDSWFKPKTAESPVPTLEKSADTGRYCFTRIEARLIILKFSLGGLFCTKTPYLPPRYPLQTIILALLVDIKLVTSTITKFWTMIIHLLLSSNSLLIIISIKTSQGCYCY